MNLSETVYVVGIENRELPDGMQLNPSFTWEKNYESRETTQDSETTTDNPRWRNLLVSGRGRWCCEIKLSKKERQPER